VDNGKVCQAACAQAALALIIGFIEKIVYTAAVSFGTIEALPHDTTII